MNEDLTSAVDADFERAREELEALVRIPSVSAPDFDSGTVRRSAEAVSELLSNSGVGDVRLLEVDGAHPAVYGEVAGPDGAQTVLLYAHHSRRGARINGIHLRSSRRSATGGSTAEAPRTTRPASSSTPRGSAPWASERR